LCYIPNSISFFSNCTSRNSRYRTVAINSDGVSVDYTPASDFNGTEVITYTVSDGTLTDETGTLTITVTSVDDAPVAVADTATVDEDAATTSIDVITNDTDADTGDTLTLTAVASSSRL